MPVMNGFQATAAIREKGHHIPIIALTAANKDDITNDLIKYGLTDVIVKPYQVSHFKKIIARNIKNSISKL